MSKSDTFEYNFLRLVYNGVAISTLAATAGTTQLWAGLHTGDPGDAGSTANEGGYTAYTRVATERSTAGWSVTSGTSAATASASPVGAISFPAVATTSTGTFTHGSIWLSSNISSSGLLYKGALSPTINFGSGVTPQITTGSSVTED